MQSLEPSLECRTLMDGCGLRMRGCVQEYTVSVGN